MFSKKHADEHPPVAPARARNAMGSNSTFSVIGADVTITGDVRSTVDLHVDGGALQSRIRCWRVVERNAGCALSVCVSWSFVMPSATRGARRPHGYAERETESASSVFE